jgi:formylglycine-generating enzyme required for sulfatase activity
MNAICKRAAAIVLMAVFAIGQTTCKKEKIDVPTVKVFEGAITISYTKASVSAEVTDQGGAEVKSRGFAYGESGGSMDTIYCGSGTGVFSADLNNLEPNTTYVYEAFAKNVGGFATSGKVTFTTKDNEKPTVKTNEVKDEDVTTTTASVSGNVTDDGGSQVTERGVCWSTNHNPTLNDSHLPAGGDLGEFTCNLTDLSANTKYYVCAYAKNSKGPAYGEEKDFTTKPLQTYTIDVSANPSNGGTVTGGGTFDEGQSCTVMARENTGYNFVNWTENNVQVSTDRDYTFQVTGDRNLVAIFTTQDYTITAIAEPEGSGTIEGIGGYNYGERCTLIAKAKPGFSFSKWTENGTQVSTNATYDFDVTGNRNLIAHFNTVDYTITAIADPVEGGRVTVSGNGGFNLGDPCTLTATPNPGYTFVNWTKGGTAVTDNPYTFNVTESAEYVGHFQSTAINLEVSANPNVIAQGSSSQLNADASGGNGSFTYSWSPTTGLNNAHIKSPTATPTNTTTYTVTVSSNGQTATGNVTVYVVRPPTNLSKTINGNNVQLTWTAPNTVSYYKVYRNGSPISGNIYQTNYTDSNLNPGTYSYYVTAVYNNVESSASNTVQATIASGGDQTFTVNGVSFTMKRVEGSTFWMGAQSTNSNGQNYDPDAYSDESPVHSVTVSTFYMGETEVTQALWQAVMGSNPSYFTGNLQRPVEQVSWNTIVNQFIPALNALTGRTFHLPTEAEWEYAARGGNQSQGFYYAGSNAIGNVAWYSGNSSSQTHSVGTKSPNELGLYDMSGNVWEWCSDWYGNYSSGSQTNPQGPSTGSDRVVRGGGCLNPAYSCRVSGIRNFSTPDFTGGSLGFRLVLSL